MTDRDWQVRIEDILDAIMKIESYAEGLDEAAFCADQRTVDAVVRNMEIIGEAAHAIPKSVEEANPRLPWGVMAEMRNILIHEYHAVDPELVYRTAVNDLPPLVPQLQAILHNAARYPAKASAE